MGGCGQPKEKKNMHGLEGAKNRGRGRPLKEKIENKWISRCSKQGAGRANLGKKEKTN